MIAELRAKARRVGGRLTEAGRQHGARGLGVEVGRLGRRAVVLPGIVVVEAIYDWRTGVRTRGVVRRTEQVVDLSVGKDPMYYQPAHPLLWRRLHRTLPIDRSRTTFVDIGAGRGRAVLLAAQTGFRRSVGIELDPGFAAEARANIERWLARHEDRDPGREVIVEQGDAAGYELPPGPLLIWLYNPFGPTTMRHVLDRICSRPDDGREPVFVAYVNPVHREVFEEYPRLVVHSHGRGWVVYRLATG
jgi:hypothetical protein